MSSTDGRTDGQGESSIPHPPQPHTPTPTNFIGRKYKNAIYLNDRHHWPYTIWVFMKWLYLTDVKTVEIIMLHGHCVNEMLSKIFFIKANISNNENIWEILCVYICMWACSYVCAQFALQEINEIFLMVQHTLHTVLLSTNGMGVVIFVDVCTYMNKSKDVITSTYTTFQQLICGHHKVPHNLTIYIITHIHIGLSWN